MFAESFHICHCMNVFPGTSLQDKIRVLENNIPRLRSAIPGASNVPFAVGVWFDANSVSELIKSGQVKDFAEYFRSLGLYAFTANAFPYGTFHNTAVKTSVYRPDWSEPERLDYTKAVADVLVNLLPDETVEGSISTVPGAYKTFDTSNLEAMCSNMLSAAGHLKRLKKETGRTLRLAFEMEPDCIWESPAGFAEFYDRFLRNDELSEYIGVCYDTCHQELLPGAPGSGMDFLMEKGIRVPKIQLSAAVSASDAASKQLLRESFQDKVYLHQTRVIRDNGILKQWDDMPDISVNDFLDEPWTSHFHIPIFTEKLPGGLLPAKTELLSVIEKLRNKSIHCPCLEIETYSYHVLPEFAKSASLEESMAKEALWLFEKLELERGK